VTQAETPTRKSARTRTRILDAAAKVLSEKGYAATRLSDVADVAEIQAPALYYYFPSRSDLIQEVIRVGSMEVRQSAEAALAALAPDADPIEKIKTVIDAHLRSLLGKPAYATAALRNIAQIPPELVAEQKVEQQRYSELWRSLIKEAQQAGLVTVDGHEPVIRMMTLGALNWTTEWWDPRRGSMKSLVGLAQRFVLAGLGCSIDPDPPE
jgi:AcrR family transcriptional regulator